MLISVNFSKSKVIQISDDLFKKIFVNNSGNEDDVYIRAITNKEITFTSLKKLSTKYEIPYSLFFAPLDIIDIQINEYEKTVLGKLPSKKDGEVFFSSRGINNSNLKEIFPLIIKDISRKQVLLKKLLPQSQKIIFKYENNITSKANYLRTLFNLELATLKNKEIALNYVVSQFENKNIFVSFSSYNYMPQQIRKDIEISGFYIKDNYFPFIFINTKDDPNTRSKIIETEGRQLLTLVYLLCSIYENNHSGKRKVSNNFLYSLTIEILLPTEELKKFNPKTYTDLQNISNIFKVTPSLVLEGYKNIISIDLYLKLRREIVNARTFLNSFGRTVKGDTSKPHLKYNGKMFSTEVIKNYKNNNLSEGYTKNILFRKRKITSKTWDSYLKILGL